MLTEEWKCVKKDKFLYRCVISTIPHGHNRGLRRYNGRSMIIYPERSLLDLPEDYPSDDILLQIVVITIMVSVLFGFMHKVTIIM